MHQLHIYFELRSYFQGIHHGRGNAEMLWESIDKSLRRLPAATKHIKNNINLFPNVLPDTSVSLSLRLMAIVKQVRQGAMRCGRCIGRARRISRMHFHSLSSQTDKHFSSHQLRLRAADALCGRERHAINLSLREVAPTRCANSCNASIKNAWNLFWHQWFLYSMILYGCGARMWFPLIWRLHFWTTTAETEVMPVKSLKKGLN